MYENRHAFILELKERNATDLVSMWFANQQPHAFASPEAFSGFRAMISRDWPQSETIALMGSANWRYSLNPRKEFSEYHAGSDVDVAIVSRGHFNETWDEVRTQHRRLWAGLNSAAKKRLRRNGENVYSGFVSPAWIPTPRNALLFRFNRARDRYSTEQIGYRKVNMMFFKSADECIDYYRRGVNLAQSKVL